jgi:hypothetical protein
MNQHGLKSILRDSGGFLIVAIKTKKKVKEHEWRSVSLHIAGRFLDPHKVSNTLHIKPDSWGKLGEPCGKNRKCKQGYWIIGSYPSAWRLETQMKSILKRISPVKQELKKFIKEDKTVRYAYLNIAVAPIKGDASAVNYFDAKLINEFTSLGINISLSIEIIGEWEKIFAELGKEKKQRLKRKQ